MARSIKNKLQSSFLGNDQELISFFKPSCLACIEKEEGKNYEVLYERSFKDDFNELSKRDSLHQISRFG